MGACRPEVSLDQKYHYHDVFEALKKNRSHELIHRLGLVLDSYGVIRCAHRLKNSPLQPTEKFPILLAQIKNSVFTRLLVKHFHHLVYHQGTAYTLAALRKEFWVPQGRAAVYSVVTTCQSCKRFTSKSYRQPDNSQLPSFRLEPSSTPFMYTAVDVFGKLIIDKEKVWVLIFVDLVCRAIDFELLTNMTAAEQLNAMRCFIARRRLPHLILSDNAAQFKLLHSLLAASLATDFKWKYIPEFSQWQGGVYERQVAIVKSSLSRTFHGSALSLSATRVALAEIAAMLNNRPLTYVSEDSEDVPIAPNDFLRAVYTIPPEVTPPNNPTPTASHLVAIWKSAQETLNQFWDAWSVRYLQSLRSEKRPYAFPKATVTFPAREGHVVLIEDKPRKRGLWKIGRILQLNVSQDGEVRSATLKVGNRKFNSKKPLSEQDFKCEIIVRPLKMLYPLELPELTVGETAAPAMENDAPIPEQEEIQIDLDTDW